MRKRILALLLAVLFAIPLTAVSAHAAAFSDIKDAKLLNAVQTLNSLGVIATADKFNPDATLTRAMFCAMAVPLSGISDVSSFKSYTSFTDVRANHWALGYINAAVKSLKLIGPRPDGTFGPDDAISYNEAVTIIVRMLGYGEADLGYNWPRNYLEKAAALGLTSGVSASTYVTRSQGAMLFYNMLYINGKDETTPYIEQTLGTKIISGALVYSVSTTPISGVTLESGDFYKSRVTLNTSLEGKKADLVVDSGGYIIAIEPVNQASKQMTIAVAGTLGITGDDGTTVVVSSSAPVYVGGASTTFSAAYSSIRKGEKVTVYYKENGAVDYISWIQSGDSLTTTVKNVLILKADAEDEDGIIGIITGDSTGFYPTRVDVNKNLQYKRADLTLDAAGNVIAAAAAKQTSKAVEPALISAMGVTSEDGKTTVIPPASVVYVDGSSTTYSAAYAEMSKEDSLTVYYKTNGSVDYIVWGRSGGDGPDVTTATALKAGAAGIQAALGVKADGLTIIKNGVKTTAEAVQPYDTLRYSGSTITVSSLRMAMYYPGGTPTELTIGGKELIVIPSAALQGGKFKYGDRVILCISTSGVVGAIVSGETVQANAVGYMTGDGTVELSNGLSLSGTAPSGIFKGMAVSVSANSNGILQISRMAMSTGGAYDSAAAKVGSRDVAAWCRYYTMSGDMIHPVNASDVPKANIEASRIKHVYAGAGGVEMMIIENLTGDALMYGYAQYVAATHTGTMAVGADENAGLKLTQFGTQTDKIGFTGSVANTAQSMSGAFVGAELVVSGGELRVRSIIRCISFNPTAEDVSGKQIKVNGTMTPIADDVLAYHRNSGRYISIADIPHVTFTSMTVYCDKAPSLGGKVRMIELR